MLLDDALFVVELVVIGISKALAFSFAIEIRA
jgi:hypothetical protein